VSHLGEVAQGTQVGRLSHQKPCGQGVRLTSNGRPLPLRRDGGGKVFRIRWSDDERPDDAFVIAVGSLKSMERRRNHAIQMAVGGHFAPYSDDATSSFAEDVAALSSENARLQKRVAQLEDSYDASRMVKRLNKMAARMNSCEPPPRPETPTKMVRLGDGVAVSQRMMDQLAAVNTSPAPYARALLRTVFTPDELRGCSLYGAKSNSHKDIAPKPGLERGRVDAVIGMLAMFSIHPQFLFNSHITVKIFLHLLSKFEMPYRVELYTVFFLAAPNFQEKGTQGNMGPGVVLVAIAATRKEVKLGN
ncbi:unnamed protein product, partial [Ixodes hexagonus]